MILPQHGVGIKAFCLWASERYTILFSYSSHRTLEPWKCHGVFAFLIFLVFYIKLFVRTYSPQPQSQGTLIPKSELQASQTYQLENEVGFFLRLLSKNPIIVMCTVHTIFSIKIDLSVYNRKIPKLSLGLLFFKGPF